MAKGPTAKPVISVLYEESTNDLIFERSGEREVRISPTATGDISEGILQAKGDIIAATGPSAAGRVGVGSVDGLPLVTDSVANSGVKWGARNGSAGVGGFAPFSAEPTSNWSRLSAGVLAWAILGVERLRLSATELLVSAGLRSTSYVQSGDGTVGAPAHSFGSETATGMYRISSGRPAIAVSGAERLSFDTHKNTNYITGDGSAGGSINIYQQITSSNDIVLAGVGTADIHVGSVAGGTGAFFIDMDIKVAAWGNGTRGHGMRILQQDNSSVIEFPSSGGVIDVPGLMNISGSIFRLNNTNTIQWKDSGGTGRTVAVVGSDNTFRIGFAAAPASNGHLLFYANGAEAGRFDPTGHLTLGNDGAVGTPIISWTSDANTGVYRIGTDSMGLTAGGVLGAQVTTAAGVVQVLLPDGVVGTPILGFASDTNTGVYSIGADIFGITAGGTERVRVSTTAVTLANDLTITSGNVLLANAKSIQFQDTAPAAKIVLSLGADNVVRVGAHTATATNGHLLFFAAGTEAGRFAPTTLAFSVTGKFYPGTDGGAQQSAAAIYAGTGVPNNANGANGDFYFRSDGGAGTSVYQRRAGAWVATAA